MSSDLPLHPGRALFAADALLPDGWARDVLLAWNGDGVLVDVQRASTPIPGIAHAAGPVVPGMPNLHSQAFERVAAGLSEAPGAARERLGRAARAVTPVQLEDIATQLYIEMLKAGITSVCEFQVLHHDTAGRRYANPAEMSLRLIAAARLAGIGLTLLPVLCTHGGFGAAPPRDDQRRSVDTVDGLIEIVQRLRGQGARIGLGLQALAALTPQGLRAAVSAVRWLDAEAPIHLPVAVQAQEVADCIAWSGQRPVQWLTANAPVDARWCLVQATHVDAGEARAIGDAGATLGLCPTTAAQRGDGLFDAVQGFEGGVAWGIGSGGHAIVSPAEELRSLETSQRLVQRRRSVLASPAGEPLADALWLAATAGGARASGRAVAGLAIGQKADLVVLQAVGARAGLAPAQVLADHVFANRGGPGVRDVWVAGTQRVAEGRHEIEAAACEAFVQARGQVLAAA